jgi:hypothetical protein
MISFPPHLRCSDELRCLCRLNGTVILRVTYGYEVNSLDDKFVRMAEEAFAELAHASIPGTFLVDAIPLCMSYAFLLLAFKLRV